MILIKLLALYGSLTKYQWTTLTSGDKTTHGRLYTNDVKWFS